MGVIKKFADGSFVEYDRGYFDDWCVYFTDKDGNRRAPHDTVYFTTLKEFASKFGTDKVYNDFVRVYDETGNCVETKVLDDITLMAGSYGSDAVSADHLFTILYMAMISEENKANTRLGKRIKRLGVYEVLYGNKTENRAASFMKGMSWKQIAEFCRKRGF